MNDRIHDETTEHTVRRLAASSQELAQAVSDARRSASAPSAAAPPGQVTAETHAAPPPAPGTADAPPRGARQRLARFVSWPVRRLLDPRFAGLSRQVDQKQLDLFDRLDQLRSESLRLNHEQTAGQTRLVALAEQELQATGSLTGALDSLTDLARGQRELIAETGVVLGSALAGVRSDTETSAAALERLATEVADLRSAGAGALLVGADVGDLDEGTARLLNYAESHAGFAAQRSLWFNPPVALGYRRGSVDVTGVNERVVEVPFAYKALSRIPPGSTIVDVGASESTVSLSLASLGYRVTAVDPRPYGLRHPNLEVVVRAAEDWDETRTFDAIVCLSTVEHIGLGAYGEPRKSGRPDRDLMRRLRRLARPGTVLVLSTRFGQPSTGWLERTYDTAAIADLLEGWEIEESAVARRVDDATWTVGEDTGSTPEGEAVVMVVARLVP
jgi:hypothetical protein